MRIAVDETESLRGGLKSVGSGPRGTAVFGVEAGLARNDMVLVPVASLGACLPDGLLEVDSSEFGME